MRAFWIHERVQSNQMPKVTSYTIERASRLRSLYHTGYAEATTIFISGTLRLKSASLPIQGIASGTQDDVLSTMFLHSSNAPQIIFHRDLDLALPERSLVYVTTDQISATGDIFVNQIFILWLDDDRPREVPEEELPQPRRRTMGRGRSFNLEAARTILAAQPGVSRRQRPKKPSH